MTYAPSTISALARYWIDRGGVNLGIVGNRSHTKGYHLGEDRIFDGSGPGIGWNDYSVQLDRDKAGLTDAASAIDLGRLGGTLTGLRRFSKWLVEECLARPARYGDIREVIYSPDGVYVKRYSAPDRKVYTSLRRNADGSITTVTPGNGDSTHYTHTHISFYRDSEKRDKVVLFAPYFAPAIPDTSTEPDPTMPTLTTYFPTNHVVTVKPTSNVRSAPSLAAPLLRPPLTAKEYWDVTGWVTGDVDPDSGSDQWITRWANGRWEYTAKANITSGPRDTTPFAAEDLSTAVASATKPLQDAITAKNAALRVIASEAAGAADITAA